MRPRRDCRNSLPCALDMTQHIAALSLALAVLAAGLPGHSTAVSAQTRKPSPGIDVQLDAIETLVREDIAQKRLPGAVVLVGIGDRTIYQKAIGDRALVPSREPMTLDTMFDLASLTKWLPRPRAS